MKNILILNAGTRNKLIKYFKETLNNRAKVIATDSFYLAPAIYEADGYYITDRYDAVGYWENIDRICEAENIGLIVSLIDPELELLALRKDHYAAKGILVNSGKYEVIHDCFDKMNTLSFLKERGFPYIKTYTSLDAAVAALENQEVAFPLFFKPRCGSGSANIARINNLNELHMHCNQHGDYIIQEFMDGQELGVDVYIDMLTQEVVSIFAKKKLKMRAGETDKSVSFKNDDLFAMIKAFCKQYGLQGANDIDVFEKDGSFYISEVNPRFGGGYLHAYACGVNFPEMLINNMNGIANKECIGNYKENVYMMKHFDIMIMEGS